MSATFHENVVETLIKIGVIQRGGKNWYLSSSARMLDIPAKYSTETRKAELDKMQAHWNIEMIKNTIPKAELAEGRCIPCDGTGSVFAKFAGPFDRKTCERCNGTGKATTDRCEPPEGQREGDTHHWVINSNRVPDEFIGWWSGEAWRFPGDNGYYFPADLPGFKYGRPCPRVAKEPTAPEITMDVVRALIEQLPRGTIWKTQIDELIEYTKLALVKFRGPPA